MSPWLVLFGSGLGASRILDTAKLWAPDLSRRVTSLVTVGLAAALGAGIEVGLRGSWESLVVVAGGAVGIAQLTHETSGMLQAIKDRNRLQVMLNFRQR